MPGPLYCNTYVCECGTRWEDIWCAGCDDECPSCGTIMEALSSEPTGEFCDHEDCGVETTEPGGNVFEDLGLPDAAARLKRAIAARAARDEGV